VAATRLRYPMPGAANRTGGLNLRHDLVAERPLLMAELAMKPAGFRESVRTALAERRANRTSGTGTAQ
jgi:hypothetical protein